MKIIKALFRNLWATICYSPYLLIYWINFPINLPRYWGAGLGWFSYKATAHRYGKALYRKSQKSSWQKMTGWRPLWVLLAALSMAFALYQTAINFDFTKQEFLEIVKAGGGTLITALISAPILFVIWLFRDQNNLWQIDNQRKDINLKDFQRLAEWASGQHLPEEKITQKTTEKKSRPNNDSQNQLMVMETTNEQWQESQAPPEGHSAHNRRMGAESLQVAAVYQLEAFLNGEYGGYFRRPAFQLLISIWAGFMREWLATNSMPALPNNISGQKVGKSYRKNINDWREGLRTHSAKPLGVALTKVLTAQAGYALLCHAVDLPRANLLGLPAEKLCLPATDLQQINLQGANLSEANLQGADLSVAQLQGADLSEANLQGANLRWAELQGADLRGVTIADTTTMVGAKIDAATQFGRLKEGADSWSDDPDDWEDAEAIRAQWQDRANPH